MKVIQQVKFICQPIKIRNLISYKKIFDTLHTVTL